MQSVVLAVLKQDAHRCIQSLILSGLFQPSEGRSGVPAGIEVSPYLDPGLVGAYRKLADDIQTLLERFGQPLPTEAGEEADPEHDLVPLRRVAEQVAGAWANLDREQQHLQAQVLNLDRSTVAARSFAQHGLPVAVLAQAERLIMRLGWLPRVAGAQFGESLAQLRSAGETLASLGDELLVLAMALPEDGPHLEGALRGLGFVTHDLGPHLQPSGDASRIREALRMQQRQWEERMTTFRRESVPQLLKALRRIHMDSLILENRRFGSTAGPLVFFQGWVPEPALESLRQRMDDMLAGRYWMNAEFARQLTTGTAHEEPVPILHRNPLLLQPFQQLVRIYGEPAYGEVDPTPVFALSFILMFGMMFGDVGQGAVLAAIGYGLFRWLPGRQDFGVLLMECGTSSMVFGVLYGNVFGIEHIVIPHLWFHPMHDIPYFLKIALLFGMVIISLGFMINVLDAVRRGAYAEAVLGKHGVAGALLYWLLAGIALRYLLAEAPLRAASPWLLGAILLLLLVLLVHQPILRWIRNERPVVPGPVMPFLLESAIEVIDTVSRYAGNTVSFLRVAAFAVMHIALFMVIFTIANMVAEATGGSVWYWLTVAIGNLVVIVVEGLLVSIQILRLEYYEFFSKFYTGTGRRFRPMGGRLEP